MHTEPRKKKESAREAAVAADGSEKEAACRERIRAARAARANTRVRESALGNEKPHADPKRSSCAPLDAAGAARDAVEDHAKALRDQEAARQAELEARAEYARIGRAIQRGEPAP